ncbi:hypothetical protein ACFOY2_38220 [Nonomuraea purpurea]|uniref:PH domain-containing protein n=1 Tax=Nonomuraea purpurea TaxID=1849276 RepID=A0ABV8GGS1_9ACTN
MADDRERTLEWVERVATFCGDAWGLAPITGRIRSAQRSIALLTDPGHR